MRPLAIPVFAFALAALSARASVCNASAAAKPHVQTAKPHWTLDHYVYDASLHQDWAVLVDCSHPASPARMTPAQNTQSREHRSRAQSAAPVRPQVSVKTGTTVDVLNAADDPASFHLAGTALETAFVGQPIRVRLGASGNMVRALVRGPHSVELAAEAKPSWGEQ